jgi:hypothetical protein
VLHHQVVLTTRDRAVASRSCTPGGRPL